LLPRIQEVVRLGKALKEIEDGTAFPRFQVDLLSRCGKFVHASMLTAETFVALHGLLQHAVSPGAPPAEVQ
jgi:hypothetical protein